MIDSFDRGYVILHNQSNEYVSTAVTKFKYSKYSLNKLVDKLKAKEEIPKAFVDEIVEFYKDKESVDTIPISLSEIRDVLLDADLLIEFVKQKQIDWEIIDIDAINNLFPKKKKPRINPKEEIPLEYMSKNALKFEAIKLEQQTEQLIEEVKSLIEKVKVNDNK
tara:strand:- start:4642 stop:5133 length:492 start_codon:yes stop_codon:yes gene_type:complete